MRSTFLNAVAFMLLFGGTVGAQSPPTIISFNFVEERGRPGHTGFSSATDDPVIGARKALAILSNDYQSVQFRFKDLGGVNLDTFTMDPIDPDEPRRLLADVTVPSVPFRVLVFGYDLSGNYFQHNPNRIYEPTDLAASFLTTGIRLRPGHIERLTVEVTNLGEAASFFVATVADPTDGYIGTDPLELNLENGATGQFQLEFSIPKEIDQSVPFEIAARVEDAETPSRNTTTRVVAIADLIPETVMLDDFESGTTDQWSSERP